ncbi:alpha/beta fold hydrolase [Streptomyces mirabilis]|uniref:alpha/beta fold hydrolase n=1 Tax=Streptomyces TaxID=1883 RepID=UPI0033BBC045
MPAVFVHGVPDTHHVWDNVRDHLTHTDVLALALPGFGSPVPQGFTATKEGYVEWIIARLEDIGSPVDLVGHDRGCALTARAASLRPDLVRTWAGGDASISGAVEWHDLGKIWQTPDVGEQWMAPLPRVLGHRRPVRAGGACRPSRKERQGQELVRLDSGHWRPVQRPRELADALTRRWESVRAQPSPREQVCRPQPT